MPSIWQRSSEVKLVCLQKKAEEVQDEDAQELLQGLVEIAREVPTLRVIATTADEQLASAVEGVAATITPLEGMDVLF